MTLTTLPPDPLPQHRLRLTEIARASSVIDPVFLASPQFNCEPLSAALGCGLTLKVETANPIRSFKGRGAGFLISTLLARGEIGGGKPLVAASAGNWGQAVAFACRGAGLTLTLFASVNANALKLERMRALGADLRLAGVDFDAAKEEARRHADAHGLRVVVDGLDVAASEGAGTMAIELLAESAQYDAIVVPLGNGAMLTGIARWFNAASPGTQIYGVCASGADAMEKSWRSGVIVTPPRIDTIADGIGVRAPIPEAVADMNGIVDDVLLVSDDVIRRAMRLVFDQAGIVSEPSGAAGVAAIMADPDLFKGRRVATILCGGNVTTEQAKMWLL